MDTTALDWVASVLGAQEVKPVRSLTFGIVSDLQLLSVDGRLLVLRRHMNEALVQRHPDLVHDEVIALGAAESVFGDLVPMVVATDAKGEVVGSPALLMTYLPGSACIHGIDPTLLAQPLAALHTSRMPMHLPPFHHWYEAQHVGVPEWSGDNRAWSTLVDFVSQPEPGWEPAFIHRDFHPGNLLWEHGHLTGIVDWGFACAGPPAIDVAHLRANLALVDGVDAADALLDQYTSSVPGYRHHPWWDAVELFTLDRDFAGVMAFNAFGSQLTVALLRSRADVYAASVAEAIEKSGS